MRRSALLLSVALTLVGCGSGDQSTIGASDSSTSSSVTGASTADAELVGTTWRASRYFVDDREVYVMPPAEPGSFRLEANGYVTGHDGCNGFGYSPDAAPDGSGEDLGKAYEVTTDTITFTGSAVSTLIGCTEQEYRSALRSVLIGTVRFLLEGQALVLSGDDGQSVHFVGADE